MHSALLLSIVMCMCMCVYLYTAICVCTFSGICGGLALA